MRLGLRVGIRKYILGLTLARLLRVKMLLNRGVDYGLNMLKSLLDERIMCKCCSHASF